MPAQQMSDILRIQQLDHVVLRVKDMDRSIDWYGRVLGCTVARRVDKIGFAQLRAGRSMIDICAADGHVGKERGTPPVKDGGHNMHHLCLKIENFDEAGLVSHLEAQGVKAFDICKRFGAEGYGPCLYIEDPDGNWIELKGPSEPPPPGVR